MPQHLDTQQLLRLSQGRLSADECRVAHAHVDACSTCQLALKSLTPATAAAAGAGRPPVVPGYEVLGRLGAGGVGVVYKARHLALKRLVALKFLRDGDLAEEGDRARFRREMESLAALRHPNLIGIHEVGEAAGGLFCALEYMDGGSLADRVAGRPRPPAEAARLVELIAAAVQAAHDKGIVHRDLKPANVLLTADGTPKVADFGLARRLDEAGQTESNAVVGTPSYMAPEQAAGMRVGPAADVWALGAILYELLTGRPPFLGETTMDTLLQVLSDEPLPPRRLNPKVPRDLETICLKCLCKERGGRYGSASDLADDLRRFLDSRPIRARPVGPLGRLTRACRRRPLVAALAAGVVVAVALGFSGVVWQWRDAVAARDRSERNYRLALDSNASLAAQGEELKALAGTEPGVVERILAVATERQEQLLREAGESPAALTVLGKTLNTFSEVYVETGDTTKALDAARRARRLFERLLRQDTDSDEYRAGLATSLERLAVAVGWRGDQAEALRLHREALAIRRGLADFAPGDPERLFHVSTSLHHVGNELAIQGDTPRAKEHWRQALALRKQLDEAGLLGPARRVQLAHSLEKMADAAYEEKDYAAARAGYRSAIELAKKRPDDTAASRQLPRLLASLGNACSLLGETDQAERETRAALALMEGLTLKQPRNALVRLELLRCRTALGDMRRGRGIVPALREQLATMGEIRGLVEKMTANDPANASWRKDLANVQGTMAGSLAALVALKAEPAGKLDEAWELLRQAKGHAEALRQSDPTNRGVVLTLANLHFQARVVLAARGDAAAASRETLAGWRSWLEFYRARARDDDRHGWWHRNVAEMHETIGTHHLVVGEFAEAATAYRRARDIYQDWQTRERHDLDWTHQKARVGFALAAALERQPETRGEALPLVRESVAAVERLVRDTPKSEPKRALWLRTLLDGHKRLEAGLPADDLQAARRQFTLWLGVLAELLQADRVAAEHYPFREAQLSGSTAGSGVPIPLLLDARRRTVKDRELTYKVSPANPGSFHNLIEAYAKLVDELDATDPRQASEMRDTLTLGRDRLRDDQQGRAHPVYRSMLTAFERRLARLGQAGKRAERP